VATITQARTVRATPGEVWRLISDPWRLPAWWPGVQRVEEATETSWTNVLASPRGKTVRADYTLVDSQPEERLVWRHEVEESPFERILAESLTEIGLEPEDGSTKVSLEAHMKLRGYARFGSFQVRRAARRQLTAALDGIEAALGGGD
jgi:carbon monoxide dehydrogenase subunit G